MVSPRYKWSLALLVVSLILMIVIVIFEKYQCVYDSSFWVIMVMILGQIITLHEERCKK